jgi:hypothetical protein
MRDELEKVSRWAQSKIDAAAEPPWAWYQYMKLIETCDAILLGMAATTTMESSPRSEPQSGAHLRRAPQSAAALICLNSRITSMCE